MSKLSDELLQEIRVFRHNYIRFQSYGTASAAKKARDALYKITKLSSLLYEEIKIERDAISASNDYTELDKLLHIPKDMKKKGK